MGTTIEDGTELLKRILVMNKATRDYLLGAGSGLLTGFFACTFARTTALMIGSSILVLELLKQRGIVDVDLTAISKKVVYDVTKFMVSDPKKLHLRGRAVNLLANNERFRGGFFGAFLVGLAIN